MSNNHLLKHLVQENGISEDEAKKVYEKRKHFRRFFKSIPIDPDKLKEIQIKVGRRKENNEKRY